jgi:hypothetical protein
MVVESRGRTRALVACAVAVSALTTGQATAAGGASSKASCLGIEASSISPPGTSDEFPGGMSELAAFVHVLAGQLGVPPGAIVSSVAKLHEGSHAACDEASE